MPPDDTQRWTSDAREHGFPVMVTGVVLFHLVLGLPYLLTLALVAALMVPLTVWAARRAFPMPEPGEWPHG